MTRKTEQKLISAAKSVLEGSYYSYGYLEAAVVAAEEEDYAEYCCRSSWPLQNWTKKDIAEPTLETLCPK